METNRKKEMTSVDFMNIWKTYDKDKSGYLERKELDNFLKDFIKEKGEPATPEAVSEYKAIFLDNFDKNKDIRFEISELARLLPVEQNFLQRFPIREKMSRSDFNEIFKHYDQNQSGFIGGNELLALLRDLFTRNGQVVNSKDLDEYANMCLGVYDLSQDGQLSRDEVGLLLSKTL